MLNVLWQATQFDQSSIDDQNFLLDNRMMDIGLSCQYKFLRILPGSSYSLRPISTATKASSGARHWHFTKTSCGIDSSLQTTCILMCVYE
jgi:hypothetical protein